MKKFCVLIEETISDEFEIYADQKKMQFQKRLKNINPANLF